MQRATRQLLRSTLLGTFFVFLDQYFKYRILSAPTQVQYILKPYLGWEYFANQGIAFSIPVPHQVVLWFTPFIVILLMGFAYRYSQQNNPLSAALIIIVFGALSNYTDRIRFGITIDYIRVFTSIINIADLMIAYGTIWILYHKTLKKK